MWPFFLNAIQLFHCIDFLTLFYFTKCTRIKYGEEVKENNKKYDKKIRIEELCLCVHYSIEEFLFVPFCHIDPYRLSCGDPWNSFMSLIYLWWILQCYYNSGVILSQNISSIIVPRYLSSLSLMLSEDCSSELCSDPGILKWVPNGPGIGRWLYSSSSSSPCCSKSSRCGCS